MPTRSRFTPFGSHHFAVVLAVLACAAGPLHGHGGYDEVVEELGEKILATPDDAALHFQLAEAHAGHDEGVLCLEELAIVERLAPGAYQVGHLRGLSLYLTGKHAEAKVVLDDFLKEHPGHAVALKARSRVLTTLGQPEAALRDAREAIARTSEPEPEAYEDLAAALHAGGRTDEAIQALDAGLAKLGAVPSMLAKALEWESAAGSWDSALKRIDGLQKTAPAPGPWMARRATLLAKAGREADSRAAWAALRDHVNGLPSLDRGAPQNLQLLQQARQALGESAPTPVAVPPAP